MLELWNVLSAWKNGPNSSLLSCVVGTNALVEAATSCDPRWPSLHRRKWTSSLHPDICEQSEATPYHKTWFPNVLVRKDHVEWVKRYFPVCPQVSPLVLITLWKPTACLWCMIRGEARFTQLPFFPLKALQTCVNSYFSSVELVGGLR